MDNDVELDYVMAENAASTNNEMMPIDEMDLDDEGQSIAPQSKKARLNPNDEDEVGDEEGDEASIADTEVAPDCRHQCRIKIDLANADRFLQSQKADEIFTSKDPYMEDYNNESYRWILTGYIANYVTPDPKDETVGWTDVIVYRPSVVGVKFEALGIITGSRVYGGKGDPFSLPKLLNGLLTGKFYWNFDDSKAYQRYMFGHDALSGASKWILDKFLENPDDIVAEIAAHYNVKVKDAKVLLHKLSMEGTTRTWRAAMGVDDECEDHPFITKYEASMRRVTKEMVTAIEDHKLRAIRKYLKDKRPLKRTDPAIKSYLLQERECEVRNAKLRVLADLNLKHGSLEHDGIKVLIDETRSPSDEDMARLLTQAASEAAGVPVPVVLKEPEEIDYGEIPDAFNSAMFIPLEELAQTDEEQELRSRLAKLQKIKDPQSASHQERDFLEGLLGDDGPSVDELSKEDIYHLIEEAEGELGCIVEVRATKYRRIYLGIMNHFFVALTAMGGAGPLAKLQLFPGTERTADCVPIVAHGLKNTFPGLESEWAFGKRDNLVSWWLRHSKRREKERIGFYTSEEVARRHSRDLNIFGGLAYDFLDVPEQIDMDLLQPLLDHIRDCLAAGDEVHYNYQLDWFATCLQKRKKIGVIMIYMGSQGVGKDMVVGDDGVMNFIYGRAFQKVAQLEQLFNRFNAEAANTMFCVLDEVGPYNKSHFKSDAFKDIITGAKMRVEPKGVDVFFMNDTRNFCATTNNEDSLKIKLGDRRQYMIRVSDEWAKPEKGGKHSEDERLRHFARIRGARYGADVPARKATDEEFELVARQFFWYLMRRDISSFIPEKFPTSQIREEQAALHEDDISEFFENWYLNWPDKPRECPTGDNLEQRERDYPPWDVTRVFYAGEILALYNRFRDRRNDARQYNSKELSAKLTRYTQYIMRGERGKAGYKFRLQNIGEAPLDAERREEFNRLWSDYVRHDSGEYHYPTDESFDVQLSLVTEKYHIFIPVLQLRISVMSAKAQREDILNVLTCLRATALAAAMAAAN